MKDYILSISLLVNGIFLLSFGIDLFHDHIANISQERIITPFWKGTAAHNGEITEYYCMAEEFGHRKIQLTGEMYEVMHIWPKELPFKAKWKATLVGRFAHQPEGLRDNGLDLHCRRLESFKIAPDGMGIWPIILKR
jgi:hypothetical protein